MLDHEQRNLRHYDIEMKMKKSFISAARELGMDEVGFVKLANLLCTESYSIDNIFRTLKVETAIKLCELLCIDLGMLQYSYNRLFHHRLITIAIKNKEFKLPMNKKIWEIYHENVSDFPGTFPKFESAWLDL